MTKNDDAMEELVGELIGGILPNLNILKEYSAKYRKEGDRHAEHEMTMATAENIVGYLITRILQAVREGKLDKELGVMGRSRIRAFKKDGAIYIDKTLHQQITSDADFLVYGELIALSPGEDFEEFIMRETEAAIEGGIIDGGTGLPFELVSPEGQEEEA